MNFLASIAQRWVLDYPLRMDPARQARLQEKTVARYQKAARRFVGWCHAEGFDPLNGREWDAALLEFRNAEPVALYEYTDVVAAVEFFFPNYKGQLTLSRAALQGWQVDHVTHHHVPLGRGPAALCSTHIAANGAPRLGVGVVLQQRKGLRPSEMLNLRREDVTLPEEQAAALGGARACVVGLGLRVGTKLKRPQSVLLYEGVDSDVIEGLRRLKKTTAPNGLLIPYSLRLYSRWLKFCEDILGLQVGWTPHSPRAGFASEGRLNKKSFTDLREEGRWTSDSSLRIYIDTVEATAISTRLLTSGLVPAQEYAIEHWLDYVPLIALLEDGAARSKAAARR